MKKHYLILMIVLFVFITGCNSGPGNTSKCSDPYILVNGKCCLDQNKNNICDENDNIKPYVSRELVTGSSSTAQVSCPKELRYSVNENPNTEVEVEFLAKYTGFGNSEFATALKCDNDFIGNTNPIRVSLEKDQVQTVKAKITTSEKVCEFKIVETSNVNHIVACKIVAKPLK